MIRAIATLKQLTLWEIVLLGLGAVFAIVNLPGALSQSEEPALALVSSLSLLGIAIFVLLGGQFRETAFFILLVFVAYHLLTSYLTNIWAYDIANLNLPANANLAPADSTMRFAFDVIVEVLAVLVAARLTFSGVVALPMETPSPHAQT